MLTRLQHDMREEGLGEWELLGNHLTSSLNRQGWPGFCDVEFDISDPNFPASFVLVEV